MSYFDVNGIELKEGMFVKVTGSKVKTENDIYIVAVDQNVNEQYYKEDAYWLHKVKLNGEESKTKYNLLPINGVTHKRPTTNLKIEVVTDLKAAKKDVKEYLNNVESKEIVNQFTESKTTNIEVGKVIKIKKHVLLKGHINKISGDYEITSIKNDMVTLHLLGKKGDKVAINSNNYYQFTPIILNFKIDMVELLFKEYDAVLLERIQVTKGELKEQAEANKKDNKQDIKKDTVSTQEDTKEENNTEVVNYTYTVTEDIDTRDNSKIYLVKVEEKLTKEEYIQVNKYIKSLGGYYSKFKHAFIFKEYPKELKGSKEKEETNTQDIEQVFESSSEVNVQNDNIEETNTKEVQEEKINITFNDNMKTIEIRIENETEETKNILKQNGYTYLSFVSAYVTDDTWEARQFLKQHYSKWLESAA